LINIIIDYYITLLLIDYWYPHYWHYLTLHY
jgi:hypothetical protein